MKRAIFFAVLLVLSSIAVAQRLPHTAVPENYQLTFTPDLAKNVFEGDETIRIRVLQQTSEVVLNAAEITFRTVTITSGSSTQTAKVTLDAAKQFATLSLEKPVPAGPATIHIVYAGILNDQMRGFYIGKDDQGRKYAATQLEDIDARRAFPSFDEPAFKATFDITIIADAGLTVISNSKVVSDVAQPAGKHTVHFATTPKMSSYLVAMVVGNFEYVEGSADGVPIRVYVSPGKKALANFALQAAEFNLHFYDQYFGIKYPYGKLDLVGLADFSAGAMENTGCITFREVLLLADEKTSISLKKTVASVIAHEMGHQWFGDLVTMQWWDDKWLNEGFATWVSSKPVAAWQPEWKVDVDEVGNTVSSLDLDSLVNTHPIHQPADTYEQIIELDDAITYTKAAAILRMLESYLGPDTFRAGITAYLKKYSYDNAAAADFWNVQTQVSRKPVDKIMPTWVEQPGAPLLSVEAKCSGNSQTLSFEQRRYFYARSRLEQGGSELWQIPACIKTSSSSAPKCELMTRKQQAFTLPGCAPWDFINANAKGFYRSGYSSQQVRSMSGSVETALTPAERIILLADVWASVAVGREPIGDYLQLAGALKSDRNDAVLAVLLPRLRRIGETLTSDADQEAYRAWLRRLLSPVAQEVGWSPKPGERESVNSLRADLLFTLAVAARDPQAQADARRLAEQALAQPGSVNNEIANTALGAAAANGDKALYDKILADLKAAKSPENYYRDLYTLGRFASPALLDRTLRFATSADVRSQDSPYLVYQVLNHQEPAGQKQAWAFVQEHWAEIEKLGGAFAGPVIVQSMGTFCDPDLREQVKSFFAAHPTPAAERSLKQSMERMNYCIDLKAAQQEALASWLNQAGH